MSEEIKCPNCGNEEVYYSASQIGGDGFNDRCCGVMDLPPMGTCDDCGWYCMDGDWYDNGSNLRKSA